MSENMTSNPALSQLSGEQPAHFDHRSSYQINVLGLADGETEEELDGRLTAEAKELGIRTDLSPRPKPRSTCTESSVPTRRSMSVYSTASQSTGLTSHFSEASREQYLGNSKRRSHASLSLRDYDMFLARGTTDSSRTSISFSRPATPAQSAFSLPLSSPEPTPKRQSRMLKGLNMLKFHRPETTGPVSGSCPHCPSDAASRRRAVHGVPCGHRLCTQALRGTVKSALASEGGAVPSCCGVPIPGGLFQHVASPEEQNALLHRLEQWDEAVSLTPAVLVEPQKTSLSEPAGTDNRKASNESRVDSVGSNEVGEMQKLEEHPECKLLQHQQLELRDRFLDWVEKRRAELQARHENLRIDMESQHEQTEDDLMERHARAMAEAEDKQVKAEADLRDLHAQERRDNATALKHMEAYCAGTYRTGELHGRSVTEQDRIELDKTRKARDAMDSKHKSAINVLRGEQARRMRMRQQRHDKEVQDLMRAQRKEELEVDRVCTAEIRELEEFVEERQRRLSGRWKLENALLTSKVGGESGRAMSWSLPIAQWPARASIDGARRASEILHGQ